MKIERINENQIRCTLSNFDLSVRNLNLNELAYGSEKARNLFREMIQKASNEVGFEAEDIPLMVEAIPLANESVMLVITKIDDPEELDTRFSKFSPSDEEEDNSWSSLASEFLEGADGLTSLLGNIQKSETSGGLPKAGGPDPETDQTPPIRVFTFDTLDMVCDAAKKTSFFTGKNVLYKSPSNQKYYLLLKKEGVDDISFSRTCNILSEYGSCLKPGTATEAYYAEHFEVIVKQDALRSLAAL